jgi:hypothetical protein
MEASVHLQTQETMPAFQMAVMSLYGEYAVAERHHQYPCVCAAGTERTKECRMQRILQQLESRAC